MTPLDLARAFLEKAREDEMLLKRVAEDRDVSDDIFGFHVQQAAEKCLKAVLAIGQTRPSKTHDLGALLGEVERSGRDIPAGLRAVEEWTPYAVRNRYPFFGAAAPIDRRAGLGLVVQLRHWVDALLEQE